MSTRLAPPATGTQAVSTAANRWNSGGWWARGPCVSSVCTGPANSTLESFIGWRAVYLNSGHDLERLGQGYLFLVRRLVGGVQRMAARAGGAVPKSDGQGVLPRGRIGLESGADIIGHGLAQRPARGGIEEQRVGLIALAPQLPVQPIQVDEDTGRLRHILYRFKIDSQRHLPARPGRELWQVVGYQRHAVIETGEALHLGIGNARD